MPRSVASAAALLRTAGSMLLLAPLLAAATASLARRATTRGREVSGKSSLSASSPRASASPRSAAAYWPGIAISAARSPLTLAISPCTWPAQVSGRVAIAITARKPSSLACTAATRAVMAPALIGLRSNFSTAVSASLRIEAAAISTLSGATPQLQPVRSEKSVAWPFRARSKSAPPPGTNSSATVQ